MLSSNLKAGTPWEPVKLGARTPFKVQINALTEMEYQKQDVRFALHHQVKAACDTYKRQSGSG
jgi:hypothetical protein